ncbi:PREDICTED: GRIP and coiled-coil domain-containing protein 2-like [Dufourea novaeangliae]|uniref:Laminin-like protein epi-1 n=1 Tax=Dufourea novaeangliae TaxID=178035 RepID=A0A154PCL0_DUFNO|nr:PREDICTED: GRIP and coiled-coil domain-containing protein 2-like [Dufourea novaeangliae]KZC09635.1 Laminin-like protein epi-1 [Dufourea novaeangliae]
MSQEEEKCRSGLPSCNVTPEKSQRTRLDSGSERRNANSHLQGIKRRIHYTPQNSPNKYSKTPQSSGSFRKDVKFQIDSTSSNRKNESSYHESLPKIQKTCPSGKFVDMLIGKWSKHMGVQNPLLQNESAQESPKTQETTQKDAMVERKIQMLQKKLKAAEESISSLTVARETESRAKEEILKQLNSDWESITKYYHEISESLKSFHEHKDNLSKTYSNIITMQESTVKRLQQELSNMRLKDTEQKNFYAAVENKVVIQENRIQEMMVAEIELKKQLECIKSESISERNHLKRIHAEEKLEFTKEHEKLTSTKDELQRQLKTVAEEKQNLSDSLKERDKDILVLQQDIIAFQNKIENLLNLNAELNVKYEKSVEKEEELKKELESKMIEIDRLRENLNTRREIETGLAKDLDTIDNKYRSLHNDFINVDNKLKETQARNAELEKTVRDNKYNSEHKVIELNKKTEILEKEKERILSENCRKIKDLESSRKLLQEKYETEIITLKTDSEAKLSELKKTLATRNSAFEKLNVNLNKISEEVKRLRKTEAKENQVNLNETAESNKAHNLTNQSKRKEYHMEDEEIIGSPKITSNDKNETVHQKKQDVYSFTTKDGDNKLDTIWSSMRQEKRIKFDINSSTKDKSLTQQNIESQRYEEEDEDSSSKSQPKKIFKTRGTGLRQYNTARKTLRK